MAPRSIVGGASRSNVTGANSVGFRRLLPTGVDAALISVGVDDADDVLLRTFTDTLRCSDGAGAGRRGPSGSARDGERERCACCVCCCCCAAVLGSARDGDSERCGPRSLTGVGESARGGDMLPGVTGKLRNCERATPD
jgi:hypothetical protein